MRLALKCSAALRILFIVNTFLINWYEDYIFRDQKRTNAGKDMNLEIDLNISFFEYMLYIVCIVAFFQSLLVIIAYLSRPCSRFSIFTYKPFVTWVIYIVEAVLLSFALYIAFIHITEAFDERTTGDLGILEKALTQLFSNPGSAAKMQLIDRLTALNFLLPVLSSILFLGYFWPVRRKNISRCYQSVQITA